MKKVIALLLAAVMVFALCACGQQGAEGKDPAAKLPEFKLGIPMENTANPAQYSYLENMVYLCGNFPNGGTAVAEADEVAGLSDIGWDGLDVDDVAEALVGDELYQPVEAWELVEVQVHSGTALTPTAVVKLKDNSTGEIKLGAAIGTGPVDAVYKAINEIVQQPNNLVEFLVQAVTEGIDANGDVTIRIEVPDSRGYTVTAQGRQRRRLFSGRGVETDIIVASAKAYMQALNKMIDALRSESEVPSGQVTDELVIEAGL